MYECTYTRTISDAAAFQWPSYIPRENTKNSASLTSKKKVTIVDDFAGI